MRRAGLLSLFGGGARTRQPLVEIVLDRGAGPQSFPLADAFTGGALRFDVVEGPASIDPVSGVVTIDTDTAPQETTIRVVAAGPGGTEAYTEIRVTVEGPEPAPTQDVQRLVIDDVTFTLAQPRPAGRYCNGDLFVVGPVTITEISPRATRTNGTDRHGTQVNPGATGNGFDGRIEAGNLAYDPALNLDPGHTGRPLQVETGSIVKAISRADDEGATASGRTWLERFAVLTIVDEPPPEGAFRPAIGGADKTSLYTEHDIDRSLLRRLPPVARMPRLADAGSGSAPLMPAWFDNSTAGGDDGRWLMPAAHYPAYGRDIGRILADAMLLTHVDASWEEKRRTVLNLVQTGLDLIAMAQGGMAEFGAGGAITSGRKPVAVYAATLLGAPELLEAVAQRAGDTPWGNAQRQFLRIGREHVGVDPFRVSAPDRIAHVPYEPEHVGMPEWRENDIRITSSLAADYRFIAGEPLYRGLLALHLTGDAAQAWGSDIPFQYVDRMHRWFAGHFRRAWSMDGPHWDQVNYPPRWVFMWFEAHRALSPLGVWEGPPERMWPPDVTLTRDGRSAIVTLDRFQCLNGGSLLRRELRWQEEGAGAWDVVENPRSRHIVTGLQGGTRYRFQTRLVSDLGPGPWSTNLPRRAEWDDPRETAPQAVIDTP